MNDSANKDLIQELTRSKYKKSYTMKSRTLPRYPQTAEREFMRINRHYMRLLKESLQKYLSDIMRTCSEGRTDSRFDIGFRLPDKIRSIMLKIAEEIEQKISFFGIEEQVQKIAFLANNTAIREWRRSVKKTLGIDLLSDYYKGNTYADALNRWVAENVSKIKSLPSDTLGTLEQIILEDFKQGKNNKQIQKDIQSAYNVNKRKAELLARDQVSTLNAQITKMQQTDAGVKKYKWSSSRDSRVRECHAELDGKTFSWDDPPEMWYKTKNGIVYTGRRCHPGEDYACRCVAIPVFDWQTVDVPINNK